MWGFEACAMREGVRGKEKRKRIVCSGVCKALISVYACLVFCLCRPTIHRSCQEGCKKSGKEVVKVSGTVHSQDEEID